MSSDSTTAMNVDRNHAGAVIARALLVSNGLSFIVIGVQLFMCIYCLTLYFESSKEAQKSRRAYIVIMVLLFVIPTFASSVDFDFLYKTTFFAATPADFLILRGTENTWLSFASAVLMLNVVNILGDGLMMYRCYIIWNDKPWVLALPVSCFITAFIFGILSFLPLTDHIALGITNVTYVSLWALTSVATNVSNTSLIAYRLIAARRHITDLTPGMDMSAVTGAVAILIESALPLSVAGVAYAVNLANTKPRNSPEIGKESAHYIFSALYFAFMSLSPQMIIFRVTTGKSWVSRRNTATAENITKGLVFARTTARENQTFTRSSTDLESASPVIEQEKREKNIDHNATEL